MSGLPLVGGGINPHLKTKSERLSTPWGDILGKVQMTAANSILSREEAESKARGQAADESRLRMKEKSLAEIEIQLAKDAERKLRSALDASWNRGMKTITSEFEKNEMKRQSVAAKESEAAKIRVAELKEKGRLERVARVIKERAEAAKISEKKRLADIIKKLK